MKTLTQIPAILLGLATLAGTARSHVQLAQRAELAPDGSFARYLRLEGAAQGQDGSYAFLIAGTSRTDYALPGGSTLEVMPELVVPLGELSSDMAPIRLPDELPEGIFVQAVLLSMDGSSIQTTDVLELGEDWRAEDEYWLRKSFSAWLTVLESYPPQFRLHVSFEVPTGGYALKTDRIDKSPKGTLVFLTVEAPGRDEIVTEAFETHETSVALGSEVGEWVVVMVALVRRGSSEAPRYEEYASLNALGMIR